LCTIGGRCVLSLWLFAGTGLLFNHRRNRPLVPACHVLTIRSHFHLFDCFRCPYNRLIPVYHSL
jgi:hypothetical protein